MIIISSMTEDLLPESKILYEDIEKMERFGPCDYCDELCEFYLSLSDNPFKSSQSCENHIAKAYRSLASSQKESQ